LATVAANEINGDWETPRASRQMHIRRQIICCRRAKHLEQLASCYTRSITVQSRFQETAKDSPIWMTIAALVHLNWRLRNVLTYVLPYLFTYFLTYLLYRVVSRQNAAVTAAGNGVCHPSLTASVNFANTVKDSSALWPQPSQRRPHDLSSLAASQQIGTDSAAQFRLSHIGGGGGSVAYPRRHKKHKPVSY